MHEFENKKAGTVITFKGTTPWTYEQKHWNAVMLYNCVNALIKADDKEYIEYNELKYKNFVYKSFKNAKEFFLQTL